MFLSSRIPDPDLDFLHIPDPGVKKAADPDPKHCCCDKIVQNHILATFVWQNVIRGIPIELHAKLQKKKLGHLR